jgi:phage tail protein X
MAGRYDNLKITSGSDGRRRLSTVIYPNIPFSTNDIYVRTVPGDRLDLLAYQFYKDVKFWWIIAHANNLGKGTFAIPEGTQVRIPNNPFAIQALFEAINQM